MAGMRGCQREMVRLAAGQFAMGSDRHYPEEAPAHVVAVDAFWIDIHPVTNEQFQTFVADTGYVTIAEQAPDPELHPGVPRHRLVAGSAVFVAPTGPVDLTVPSWWEYRPGACWHAPDGPGSGVEDRLDHPVVHVAYRDAAAYSRWAGARLPTEAEWEYAARGGLDGCAYAWGDQARPAASVPANVWVGPFPSRSQEKHPGTTAVGAFPPNGFGLMDMTGNVWEWTQDWYEPGHPVSGCCVPRNPAGPPHPPDDPLAVGAPERVLKGGSFLCADNYCARYRPAARIPQAEDGSTCHVGFRCVRDATTA